MGKYMRKAKITGDVAVMMEQSPLGGVRTRAKTLALQTLQSSSSYLQLRSRRLEKVPPLFLSDPKKQHPTPKDGCAQNPSANPSSRATSRLSVRSMNSASVGSVSISCSNYAKGLISEFTARPSKEVETKEPSFGENNPDFEGRERSTRESTPCSLIRESDTGGTPGSTTRQSASTAINSRIQNAVQRNIPTPQEIEEFFASAEQQQRKLFTEKYNFDIVNGLPLPGRYEWVRVNH